MATHLEQFHNGLPCEFIDHLEGTGAIGCTGIIAQIQIVVLGQQLADAMQNGQSPIPAVEDADGTLFHQRSLSF